MFDSSRILSVRGGIRMSIGNSPEVLSQLILVGMILVWKLGIPLGVFGLRALDCLGFRVWGLTV